MDIIKEAAIKIKVLLIVFGIEKILRANKLMKCHEIVATHWVTFERRRMCKLLYDQ